MSFPIQKISLQILVFQTSTFLYRIFGKRGGVTPSASENGKKGDMSTHGVGAQLSLLALIFQVPKKYIT